jgi:hypothetical protein
MFVCRLELFIIHLSPMYIHIYVYICVYINISIYMHMLSPRQNPMLSIKPLIKPCIFIYYISIVMVVCRLEPFIVPFHYPSISYVCVCVCVHVF